MRTGLSVESINLQLAMPKLMDGTNLHPKSTILLMSPNSSELSIIATTTLLVC